MNIEEIQGIAAHIKTLSLKSTDIIAGLKGFVGENLNQHFAILEEKPHSLLLSFYGLRLLFRVEIQWHARHVGATIIAYVLGYDEPLKRVPLTVYQFDNLGNITNKEGHVIDAILFPKCIITDVFTLMAENAEMKLIP